MHSAKGDPYAQVSHVLAELCNQATGSVHRLVERHICTDATACLGQAGAEVGPRKGRDHANNGALVSPFSRTAAHAKPRRRYASHMQVTC
eukprot:1160436-Pelagomonas_calceolata.AAC.4